VKYLSRVRTRIAVLAVISKRSQSRGQAIAAATLREIRNDLKKHYLKSLSKRQVLNVIREMGSVIVKEPDPRDGRRTLYRINPNLVENRFLSLIKLDQEKAYVHDGYEGILYDPPTPGGFKFLAIDDIRHPAKVNSCDEFEVDVDISYRFVVPNRFFLGVFDSNAGLTWLAEISWGEGLKTYTLNLVAPLPKLRTSEWKPSEWKLKVKAYYQEGKRWCEADSISTTIQLDPFPKRDKITVGDYEAYWSVLKEHNLIGPPILPCQ